MRAFDSSGLSSGYSSYVTGTTDTRPAFTGSLAGTTFNLTAQHAFSLTLTAKGNPTDFSYSIVNPPTGMKVNTSTGVVTWTPSDSSVGTTNVTFQVSSSAGTGGTVDYNFAVAPNLPVPQYASANLIKGTLYATPTGQLPMQLSDTFSNSTVTWSLVSGPAGMTVNATTGAVAWRPSATTATGERPCDLQGHQLRRQCDPARVHHRRFRKLAEQCDGIEPDVRHQRRSQLISWGLPATNASKVAKYRAAGHAAGGLRHLHDHLRGHRAARGNSNCPVWTDTPT